MKNVEEHGAQGWACGRQAQAQAPEAARGFLLALLGLRRCQGNGTLRRPADRAGGQTRGPVVGMQPYTESSQPRPQPPAASAHERAQGRSAEPSPS